MVSRLRCSREISRILSPLYSAQVVIPFSPGWVKRGESTGKKCINVRRFSAVSEVPERLPLEVDVLTFFASTLDEHEGPCHYWLNKHEKTKVPFKRDGLFLVLAGAFLRESLKLQSDHVLMFERVKLLQRRYPQLHVFGFQADNSIYSVSSQALLIQTIMTEYITFPVLLSKKSFTKMKNGAHYLLFKDFKCPVNYHDGGTETEMICKAIEVLQNDNSEIVDNSREIGEKELDVIKDPYHCPFRNLLLCFPGCISVDEDGNRVFLSDSNHHRIIILAGNGKILDCIGSIPGFEDGDFESSKLLRPAASLYNANDDCLYFVDSENHAVRRADMKNRFVQTIYPSCGTGNKFNSIWIWILDKLGIEREVAAKSVEFNMESLISPWHLMKSREDSLLIVNRSFHTLWILNSVSGKIEEVVTGYQKIMEVCGEKIMEKLSLFNQMFGHHLVSTEGHPDVSLMSSLVTFQNDIIYCDTVSQAILKQNSESGVISSLQLSNYGALGIPYWVSLPFEKPNLHKDARLKSQFDHFQCFSVLPGRCIIQINIDIPVETEVAAPLQGGSIWRRVRGSAVDVSELDVVDAVTEKVGVAQQWFDELDNLAFTTVLEASVKDEDVNSGRTQEKNRVQIGCAVNISPGTSEVLISAVLYLKLKSCNSHENIRKENLRKMLEMVNDNSGKQGTVAFTQLMLESKRDLREVIFTKPVHLRISLNGYDHPKTDKLNEIVLTDSAVEVNVSLQ